VPLICPINDTVVSAVALGEGDGDDVAIRLGAEETAAGAFGDVASAKKRTPVPKISSAAKPAAGPKNGWAFSPPRASLLRLASEGRFILNSRGGRSWWELEPLRLHLRLRLWLGLLYCV
jgi:hypothetical protein